MDVGEMGRRAVLITEKGRLAVGTSSICFGSNHLKSFFKLLACTAGLFEALQAASSWHDLLIKRKW